MSNSRPQTVWTTGTTRPTTTGRPRTAQSRPGTARPQTAASEGSYVIAILEGRGVAREVGIAAIDKDTGRVMLVQVSLLKNLVGRDYMLTRRDARIACRLSDLRKDASSDALTLALSHSRPRYISGRV